ncbi:MAG: alpha/beta hydrolase [Pseudomonadales bacterium]|nr:alpha/beta hydrolase [Pseudomonadales bacterium]
MLLFNGGPGCDDYLRPLAEMLSHSYQVIRFEARGCGNSVWDGRYDMQTLLADTDRILDHYQLDRVLLAGHSFGPDVALAWILSNPDRARRAAGLVGIAGGRIVNDRQWHEIYRQRLQTEGEAQSQNWNADPAVNPDCMASYREMMQKPDLLRQIADLYLPAHYIMAGNDIRPDWPTRQLANLLPAGDYEVIAGASHVIWLSHAEALNRALNQAVSRILDQ